MRRRRSWRGGAWLDAGLGRQERRAWPARLAPGGGRVAGLGGAGLGGRTRLWPVAAGAAGCPCGTGGLRAAVAWMLTGLAPGGTRLTRLQESAVPSSIPASRVSTWLRGCASGCSVTLYHAPVPHGDGYDSGHVWRRPASSSFVVVVLVFVLVFILVLVLVVLFVLADALVRPRAILAASSAGLDDAEQHFFLLAQAVLSRA